MLRDNALIVAYSVFGTVVLVVFALITIFYEGDKTVALGGLTALAVMGFGQLAGLKASADNKAGIAAVKATTVAVETKTDALTVAVDGRMTLLIETVKELAATQQRLATSQGLAHGITIGRGQVGAVAVDPLVAVTPGSTPPAGIPIVAMPGAAVPIVAALDVSVLNVDVLNVQKPNASDADTGAQADHDVSDKARDKLK